MKIFVLLPLAASALATPIIELDSRQAAPPPDQITIISAMTSGNGCPSGTVSTTFSPDKTLVTFGFDAFQTYIGPETKPQDHSKNCQIHLSLKCKLNIHLISIIDPTNDHRPWRLPILAHASHIPRLRPYGFRCERKLPFNILFLPECIQHGQLQGYDQRAGLPQWPNLHQG